MEPDSGITALISFIKKHWMPIFVAVIGLICLGYGMIRLQNHSQATNSPLNFSSTTPEATQAPLKNMVIDVEGGVVNPGIYHLADEARVQDGIVAAGGLSTDADKSMVAKKLNLATKLTDGEKLYIPTLADATQSAVLNTNQADTGGSVAGSSTGIININSATESELDGLPGVGPVTAGKIIDGRPYGSINDLVSKKIVGQKEFDKIKDQITAQ